MKSYLVLSAKHLALVLTAVFLFGAATRGLAQASADAGDIGADSQPAPGVAVTASHHSLSMYSMSTDTVVLTATPVGGATVPSGGAGASAAVVSGLPAGIAASWSSPTVSGAGAVSWTLTLTGGVYAVASSGTLILSAQIAGAAGNVYSGRLGIPIKVVFSSPNLDFSPIITHAPVIQGGSISDPFTFTGGGSFHGDVTLTVSGLPSSVAYSWSNPVALSANTKTSTLTLAPSAASTVQWDEFTVTAAGDGLSVSKNYTVEVEPSAGVLVQLSNSAATIAPQGTATMSVTAKPINGIALPAGATGARAAIVSALPAGVTASWSSPTVNADGAAAWTLTLTADGTAQTGASVVDLAVQITDVHTGLVYSASPTFALLTSLLANVSIGSTPGIGIPVNFLGLSHEWAEARQMMGESATGVNTIYRQLLANLTSYGSGQMNIRIGGESTDTSGEPTPDTVEPFAELSAALGAQFELGVNLGADNVQLAVDQATDFTNHMPAGSLLALEIGNEPDLFVKNGYRPAGYSFQDYLQDFNTWAKAIAPAANGVNLAGPADSGYFFGTGPTMGAIYLANTETYLADESSVLAMFTQHLYAASPADNPTPDFLLSAKAATSGPLLFAPAAQAARAYGIPFRMGEIGPVSDGGVLGVSNTFASALWAVDILFNYASVGAAGVNIDASGGNPNDPFSFTIATSDRMNTYALNTVTPIYSGLLFFQVALGDGAQLLPVTLQTPANLTAWATAPVGRHPRVAILNKDEIQSGNVSITMPGYSQAKVLRLAAPSYTSTNGVTFAGQTMDGSVDGKLRGAKTEETVEASPDGSFQVSMPVTSAALVVFSN